jgi:hypothetical protein
VGLSWQLWAPPLDPPDEGGLPALYAQEIADKFWTSDPWLALALMWESYAATLPPAPEVVSVSTGVQTVGYASPGGPFALAMARAQWFRDQRGSLVSVPLTTGPPLDLWPVDYWQRDLEHPP